MCLGLQYIFFPKISFYKRSHFYLGVSQEKAAPWRMSDNGIALRQTSGRISWITFIMLLVDLPITGLKSQDYLNLGMSVLFESRPLFS